MTNRARSLNTALFLAAACTASAMAQGTVVIDRPVRPPWRPNRVTTTPLIVKYQRVYTQITDGVAVTRVEQTFRNPLNTQVEGTYVYPLPDGVAVSDFTMTVGGKTLSGEVLDKETARRTYEEIVRRTRDPGLLEYMNSRLYQASIFPIPPGDTLDVKLEYTQTLTESGGLGRYVHPFSAAEADRPPIEQVVIQVKLVSKLPLTSVFCPSHQTDISRPSDREATVTFEASHSRPDRDFVLYYQRRDAQFGLSLLTHRAAGEDGYYLLRISPRVDFDEQGVLPKDIAFVIDTSGSMSGGKIEQVRRSLEFCVQSLNPADRFNIYTFSTDVRPFRDGLVPADGDIRAAAVDHARALKAVGGTNIHAALRAALDADPKDAARPYLIVFMTDGEPTVDVTDPEQLRQNVKSANAGAARIHVLGVGTQVNTHLLDKIAEDNNGSREYATEQEELEIKLGGLVTRLSSPVLTDVKLAIDGMTPRDQYPSRLPDLFRGGELLVLGRYEGEGTHRVEFTGTLRGDSKSLTFEGDFARINRENDFLPRLWANRKIAYLLDEIRLHGENRELVDEVVRLAKRHGIVTPYTSSLILENEAQLARGGFAPSRQPSPRDAVMRRRAERLARANEDAGGRGRAGGMAAPPASEAAAKTSRELAAMSRLGYIAQDEDGAEDAGQPSVIQHAGGRTFVRDGERWVDAAWDGKSEPTRVTAFTDAYFKLLAEQPELAKAFALGPRVVIVLGGKAYETVEETP
jgi:Ca-activated chloride channel family protein